MYLLAEVQDLSDIVLALFVAFVLEVLLGLPEVDLECLVVHAEGSGGIEQSDALLGVLDILVEHVSDLVAGELGAINLVSHLERLHMSRADGTGTAELGLELLLGDVLRDESHIDVRLEHLLLVLHNRVQVATLGLEVALLLINMREAEDGLIIKLELHVDSLASSNGVLVVLEADKSMTRLETHLNTGNLTVLAEKIAQALGVVISGQVLQEQVGVALSLSLTLVSLRMDNNADILTVDSFFVERLNSLLGIIGGIVLHIAEATGSTVAVDFELARANLAESSEHVSETLLVERLGQVTDEQVSLAVELAILLLVEHDLLAVNHGVVHLSEATLSLGGIVEVQVTESLGAVGLIEHDASIFELELAGGEMLVKIEVEHRVGKVANIERVRRVALLLGAIVGRLTTGGTVHKTLHLVANLNERTRHVLHVQGHSHHTLHSAASAHVLGLLTMETRAAGSTRLLSSVLLAVGRLRSAGHATRLTGPLLEEAGLTLHLLHHLSVVLRVLLEVLRHGHLALVHEAALRVTLREAGSLLTAGGLWGHRHHVLHLSILSRRLRLLSLLVCVHFGKIDLLRKNIRLVLQ